VKENQPAVIIWLDLACSKRRLRTNYCVKMRMMYASIYVTDAQPYAT